MIALPSIADQVRNAAACAAQARAEKVRAMVGPGTSVRVQQANALRLAVLRCMAASSDITTRQLYLRVCADMKVGEGTLHHIVYDLRTRGWAASHVAPNRKGIRIGTGRVNAWRITTTGRVALVELTASAEATADTDEATTDAAPAIATTPRTGAH